MSKKKGHVSKIKRALVKGGKGEGALLLSNWVTCKSIRGTSYKIKGAHFHPCCAMVAMISCPVGSCWYKVHFNQSSQY